MLELKMFTVRSSESLLWNYFCETLCYQAKNNFTAWKLQHILHTKHCSANPQWILHYQSLDTTYNTLTFPNLLLFTYYSKLYLLSH